MAVIGDKVDKQMNPFPQHSSNGFADEKVPTMHKEALRAETAHEAAERGHAATDKSVPILSSGNPFTNRHVDMGEHLCSLTQQLKPGFAGRSTSISSLRCRSSTFSALSTAPILVGAVFDREYKILD
jgi:hypothetical protein